MTITDIRYGEIRDGRGTIEVETDSGYVHTITEPDDVLLVDPDHSAEPPKPHPMAVAWIMRRYGMLLI